MAMLLPHPCKLMMSIPSGGYNSTFNLTIGWPVPTGIYNNSNLTVTPVSSYDAQPLGLSYFEINRISSSYSLAILVIFDLQALPFSIQLKFCNLSSLTWGGVNSSIYSNTTLPSVSNATNCTLTPAFPVPPLCGKNHHTLVVEVILIDFQFCLLLAVPPYPPQNISFVDSCVSRSYCECWLLSCQQVRHMP